MYESHTDRAHQSVVDLNIRIFDSFLHEIPDLTRKEEGIVEWMNLTDTPENKVVELKAAYK